MFGTANKFITALVAGSIGWATLVVNSDPSRVTSSEWIAGGTYLAIALGVYQVANKTA